MTGARRLAVPEPVAVLAGQGGRPEAVDRHEVVAVRESWLVEDRWWTERPLRRRYWEVVTVDGLRAAALAGQDDDRLGDGEAAGAGHEMPPRARTG